MAALPSIKSLAATVVLGAIATLAQAAPGAFQLTGDRSCDGFVPAVRLAWTPSAGAASYDVIRDDGQHTVVELVEVFYDTNVVVGGPAHTYFVRAMDGSGGTTDSNSVTVAPPPTPCSLPPAAFTITGKALCYPGDPKRAVSPAEQLDWPSARFATSYDIFKNGSFYKSIAGGGAAYTFIGFDVGGTTNSYFVVAKNAAGTTNSNTVTFTIPADICVTAPPVAALSGSTECSSQTHRPIVSLHWTSVAQATGWQVYRDGIPYAKLGFGQSYGDTNVIPGHTYTYNVATNGISAPLSNPVSVQVSEAVCVPTTVSLTATPSCTGNAPAVSLVWTDSDNGATYTVLRGNTTLASGLRDPKYVDFTPVTGSTYTYQVIATNGSGSTPSAPATIHIDDDLCPPSSFTVRAIDFCSKGTPSVLLTWLRSAHAASYTVYRGNVQIGGTQPASATEYIDVPPPGFYRYTIKATNAAGSNDASADGFATDGACASAPGAFTASAIPICSNGKQAVRVQWTPASGATAYSVVRNGTILPFLPSTVSTYEDAAVSAGQDYTYRVIASNSTFPNGTTNSTASAGTVTSSSADCPPGPFTVGALAGCNPPVTLAWTAPLNTVSNFTIFRNQASIATVGPNTFTYAEDNALPSGNYRYFVRAAGFAGVTDSNTFDVTFNRAFCAGQSPNLAALDIQPSVLSGHAADEMSIAVELANVGSVSASPATARIRFGRGSSMSSSDSALATFAVPAMQSGAHMQRTVSVKLPSIAAGTYYFFFSLDEEHSSGDANADDNVKASAAFTLGDIVPPRRRAAGH